MKINHAILLSILCLLSSASATIISPQSVISEEYVYRSAEKAIDGSGLSTTLNTGASLSTALSTTHIYNTGWDKSFVSSNKGADFFANLGTDTDLDIVLDLTNGGDIDFQSVLLWQYQYNGGNANKMTGNDLRTLEIRINTEAEGSSTFSATPDATVTMLPVLDGDTDDTNDLGGINSAQKYALGSQHGRYALISITDNYYGLNGITIGGDRVGLGEIRFATETVVPEPAAYLLVLFCSGGFLLTRRLFA